MKYSILILLFAFLSTSFIMGQDVIINSDTTNTDKTNQITIEGIAYNRKGGAIVECESIHYWIEGKDHWDDEYESKKVLVKGNMITSIDHRVFLDTNEIKYQGIPVNSEAELRSFNKMYIIKNAIISLAE